MSWVTLVTVSQCLMLPVSFIWETKLRDISKLLSQGLLKSRTHAPCHEMCLLMFWVLLLTNGRGGKERLYSIIASQTGAMPDSSEKNNYIIASLLCLKYCTRRKLLKNIISFNLYNKYVGYVLIIPFLHVKKLMLNHCNFQIRKRMYEIFLACKDGLS